MTSSLRTDGQLVDELDALLRRPWWHELAACRTSGTKVFFNGTHQGVEAAVAICATCPVEDVCLAVALEDPELRGVWGGTTSSERRRQRKSAGSL